MNPDTEAYVYVDGCDPVAIVVQPHADESHGLITLEVEGEDVTMNRMGDDPDYGFMVETSGSVPIEVLVLLVRAAGYDVTGRCYDNDADAMARLETLVGA